MKRLSVFAACIALAVACLAQDATRIHYVQLLPPTSTTNASTTGATFDLSAYKGNAAFLVEVGTASATNQRTTVTFQHSSASNFTPFETVTNINATAGVLANSVGLTTTNGVGLMKFDCGTQRLKKYVRAVVAQSLADHSAPVSVLFVAPFKAE
jgi:hypothetical protein